MNLNKIKKIFCIGACVLLMVTAFLSLVPITSGEDIIEDFAIPTWGGGMVHCDPQLSDNIRMPVPTTNVDTVWYRCGFEGFLGTWGNGFAGNSKIAANTFNKFNGKDNLIIYDFYGNRIWSSGQWKLFNPENPWSLNLVAAFSTPMVDTNDLVIACDNQKIILVMQNLYWILKNFKM